MIPIPSGVRVWIATGHTDMRCGMNSLALLVQEAFTRNPHGGDLYVFLGKSGKLIKILWHDGLACRFTLNAWSAASSFGHRPRPASFRSRCRNSLISSTALIGEIHNIRGVPGRPAEIELWLIDSGVEIDRTNQRDCADVTRMVEIADHLPDDNAALKAALIEARAKLVGAHALIDHLQLVIAKMKRVTDGLNFT
jgi:transposase